VALGAVVVEKHITLSRAMKGRDHTLSLEPDDLRLMVNGLRNVEAGLQTSSITGERTKLGRSIVSARAIPEGRLISEEDLRLKSPGTGLRWRERVSLLGHHAARDIPANVLLFAKDVNAED
jgi:sialic acid synthase SpsE